MRAALDEDASWIMEEGGAARLPIGLHLGQGGGRRGGGFGPRGRAFLVSRARDMPAKTRGLDLLLDGGEPLRKLLRLVFHCVMDEARGEVPDMTFLAVFGFLVIVKKVGLECGLVSSEGSGMEISCTHSRLRLRGVSVNLLLGAPCSFNFV